MNERDGSSTTDLDQKELPPIPDGGLGKGLPSWLEAPPSRPLKPAGEPTPIDLGTLGADAQLPQWLQELSGRVDQGETPVDGAGDGAPQEQAAAEPAAQPDTIVMTSEPLPEPPAAVARPVEVTPAEPAQPVVVTPEPRQIGIYFLYALTVIVVAALAAWLIWA